MSGSAEQSQYTCRRDQSCYNRSICRRQAFLGADFRIFGKRGIKTGLASGSADESEGSANFRTQSLISATWASSIGLESHDTDFEENRPFYLFAIAFGAVQLCISPSYQVWQDIGDSANCPGRLRCQMPFPFSPGQLICPLVVMCKMKVHNLFEIVYLSSPESGQLDLLLSEYAGSPKDTVLWFEEPTVDASSCLSLSNVRRSRRASWQHTVCSSPSRPS